MNNKMTEAKEELQETLLRIESGKKQLESMIQQSRAIETTLMELNSTIEVLEQLKKNKVGTEILVPIGGDSFAKASLKDNENVLVGVGARVSVEKKVDDAIKTIKDRAEELGRILVKARENAVNINNQIEELSSTAQNLLQKAKTKK